LASLFFVGGCKQLHSSGYQQIGKSSGNFGFHCILGETDSDDYDRILHINGFAVAYDPQSTRLDSFNLVINNLSVSQNTESHELNYVAGKKYTLDIKTAYGEATGSITAPSISGIQFVNLPDTHYTNKPLVIKWKYPTGESNNGGIIVSANNYISNILSPETTEYNIPVTALKNMTGSIQITVTSVRFVKFPKLINPNDDFYVFIDGLDWTVGTYFGVFYSINRYVRFLKSNQP